MKVHLVMAFTEVTAVELPEVCPHCGAPWKLSDWRAGAGGGLGQDSLQEISLVEESSRVWRESPRYSQFESGGVDDINSEGALEYLCNNCMKFVLKVETLPTEIQMEMLLKIEQQVHDRLVKLDQMLEEGK